ncbi:ABC transporter ATP-binding protein [Zavarzinia sp.]|uniref:ABC transporter ATP-binding protein n=1 Tax=Zavarzinia sp. TaxID=2027920 RepID=UPI003563D012
MTGPAALHVADVAHRFGRQEALRGVSLEVPAGRFTALLGPNGAGKTTLFSIVTRLYEQQAGRVAVFGRDLQAAPTRALADMGVVFQARTLDPDLTARQNLAYHAALHGLAGRAVRSRIDELLAAAGLSEKRDEKVRSLSGGQARRVEIARALVHGPRLLLLDEPTVGLDLAARAGILETVRGLVRDHGLSVLWATHIFEEIADDDLVHVLHRGRIVATGEAGTVGGEVGLAAAFRRLTEVAA